MEAGGPGAGNFPSLRQHKGDGVGGRADPILAVSEGRTDGFCCWMSCEVEA